MAASCEPVDDLRESSDFLLLAQRRAGTVPIFAKFRYKRFRFHFLFTLHFLPCFFFSTSILAMVLSCWIVLWAQAFPACLLRFTGRELQFWTPVPNLQNFWRDISLR